MLPFEPVSDAASLFIVTSRCARQVNIFFDSERGSKIGLVLLLVEITFGVCGSGSEYVELLK